MKSYLFSCSLPLTFVSGFIDPQGDHWSTRSGGIWPLEIFSISLVLIIFQVDSGSADLQQFTNDGADKEKVDKDSTVGIPEHSHKKERINLR